MKLEFKPVAAVVFMLLLLMSFQLTYAEEGYNSDGKYFVDWATPTEAMVPVFLHAPKHGTPDLWSYSIQFNATESFSKIVLVLCGSGSFKISLYDWYYNYNATIERDPVWTSDYTITEDGFYGVECGTLPAGEYILLLSDAEAAGSHIGMYTVPEPDYDVETWNDLGIAYILCGRLLYDKKPNRNYGEISSEQEVPGSETPAPTSATQQPVKETPTATSPSTTEKNTNGGKSNQGADDDKATSNEILYIVIAVAGVAIVGSLVYIVAKVIRKK